MLDTVRFLVDVERAQVDAVPGWMSKESHTFDGWNPDFQPAMSWMMRHEETGCRVAQDSFGTWAEVSLPRLVYPHNGIVLGTDADIDRAMRSFRALVASVGVSLRRMTRADLCWQYAWSPASDVIRAFTGARHPAIRKSPPAVWFDQSVSWVGSERVFRCYDKVRELTNQPGNVIRFEMQARKGALDGIREGRLSIDALWPEYTAQWLRMKPFATWDRSRPLTLGGFLALLLDHGCTLKDGTPVTDVYLSARSERHVRRLRTQIAAARLQELLSVPASVWFGDVPPPPVNVEIAA